MKQHNPRKPLYISFFWLALGALLVLGHLTLRLDDYWMGMGAALIGVGTAQTVRHIRCARDSAHQECRSIEAGDERNKFISSKAWAWAGYLYVLIAAIGSIVCKLLGQDKLMQFCAVSVCMLMALYWLSCCA